LKVTALCLRVFVVADISASADLRVKVVTKSATVRKKTVAVKQLANGPYCRVSKKTMASYTNASMLQRSTRWRHGKIKIHAT